MMSYMNFDELNELQVNEELKELSLQMLADEYRIKQRVKYDVSVKLASEIVTERLYNKERDESEYLLIFDGSLVIPKSDNSIQNMCLLYMVQKVLDQGKFICSLTENEQSYELDVHRSESDYFVEIKQLYVIKDELIQLLNPVLEFYKVPECKVTLYLI